MRKIKLSLFFLFTLLLPSNLGKHFELGSSYVCGILVDYLVPAIYLQDVLVVFYMVVVALHLRTDKEYSSSFYRELKGIVLGKTFLFGVLLMACLFLSVLVTDLPLTALSYVARIFLVSMLILLLQADPDREQLRRVFGVSLCLAILFISLLGLVQLAKQSSVFDNYLFLGEQPYSAMDRTLLKESIFGRSYIPPYSLFRHPNTFAGFLVISLFLLFYSGTRLPKALLIFTGCAGIVALLATFSWIAILGLALFSGLFFLGNAKITRFVAGCVLVLGFALPLLLHIFPVLSNAPSFSRRSDLIERTYNSLPMYFMFGKGLGTSTSLFNGTYFLTRDLSFFQPVHNVFLLLFLESGVFALVLLSILFYRASLVDGRAACLFGLLVFLGSFDHYLLTMHQPLYLIGFLCGVALLNPTPQKDLLAKN